MKLSGISLWLLAASIVHAGKSQFEAFENEFYFKDHLGTISVYHEPYFNGPTTSFPESCAIKQVHLLQRHGSRNPTGDDTATDVSSAQYIDIFQNKLLNGSIPVNFSYPENPLYFVKHWTPVIKAENADQLSSSGRIELFDLGRQVFERYYELFDTDVYDINTAAQERVVDSAEWFSYGMFGDDMQNKTNFIVLPEDDSAGANSLAMYYSCPVYEDNNIDENTTEAAHTSWRNVFLKPIANRLNKYFDSGYNLTVSDVRSLYYICVYEIALRDNSDFCSLFTPSEFLNFEYDSDLDYAYWGGPASEWASTLGGAYVNNLANNLRKGVNNASDRKVFLAFTHDSQIIPVEAALGFFPDITPEHPLPTDKNTFTYSLKTSSFVPFAGNLITELFLCSDNKYYVRHLVNQQVYPLTDCGYGPSGASDGLCELSAYLNSSVRVNSTSNGIANFNSQCQAHSTNVTVYY
ncbi:Thiamine-repressible acid phosphatase pho4 [Schizosaccharomyces pombe]